jgi:DNA topoisomerase-1
LPGQDIFQYLDETGELHSVRSDHVDAYLREISGEEIAPKDFLTWAAINLAALAILVRLH